MAVVGLTVGAVVGLTVGAVVGLTVGAVVGLTVGATVGHSPQSLGQFSQFSPLSQIPFPQYSLGISSQLTPRQTSTFASTRFPS